MGTQQQLPKPDPNTYWVVPGQLLAGEYPGARDPDEARRRLRKFLDVGVRHFIDLTEAGELEPYEALLKDEAGPPTTYERIPIHDVSVPDEPKTVAEIIQLKPDQPELLVTEAWWAFQEKADANAARAACDRLPSSIKDDPFVLESRVYFAMCARDFGAAEEILREDRNKEINLWGALVSNEIYTLWLEFIQGTHLTVEQFGAAREQLYQKVEADPTNPFLIMSLARSDLALGRKEEAIEEGRRAMELRPIFEDAFDGPVLATWIAEVYAFGNQLDKAFAQLDILVTTPGSWTLNYGDLKTNPAWDPLRKDQRFDKLLAELAPRD